VGIPVPGEEKPAEIVCTFAHMTRDEFREFAAPEASAARSDAESLARIMRGWEEVDVPFSAEAVAQLCQQYHGAAFAISSAFVAELTKARLGN
jgi:hypothetical protein